MSTQDEVFDRLLGEWRAFQSGPASIDDWEASFSSLVREQQSLREVGAWTHGRDDLFGILGVQRGETLHSAMVAWLLDPCARHGLGTRFLDLVLRRAFPDEGFDRLGDARVTCEVTRGACRADIVIEVGSACIVVENKVDAPESLRQCDILYETFGGTPGARFVFLTPTGRPPATATGDALEAFATLGYGDIRGSLETALKEQSATSVPCRAATDYLQTLKKEFR